MSLGHYIEDAKETLEVAFAVNNTMNISTFDSPIMSQAVIDSCVIDALNDDESNRANIQMAVQYNEFVLNPETNVFDKVLSAMNLVILNSEGDNRWTNRMKVRIWNGHYPDSVAIDRATGEVYLLYLTDMYGMDTIELAHFGKIPLDKLEGILLTLNYNHPYYIFVDDKAMFDVIDGAEGYHHLHKNVYIALEGTSEYRVYRHEVEGVMNANANSEDVN